MSIGLQLFGTKSDIPNRTGQDNKWNRNPVPEAQRHGFRPILHRDVLSGDDSSTFVCMNDVHIDMEPPTPSVTQAEEREILLEKERTFMKTQNRNECPEAVISIPHLNVQAGLVVTDNGVPANGKFYVARPASHNNDALSYMQEKEENEEGDSVDGIHNWCCNVMSGAHNKVSAFFKAHRRIAFRFFLLFVLVGYLVYFGFSMNYKFGDEGSWRLLILTGFVGLLVVSNLLARVCENQSGQVLTSISHLSESRKGKFITMLLKCALHAAMLVFTVAYLIAEIFIYHPRNMASLGGIVAFIIILFLTSTSPSKVNWFPVFWGMSLQFIFALLILRTNLGRDMFEYLGDRVTEFLAHSTKGAQFVFDLEQLQRNGIPIFAFSVLPIIVFVGSVTSILYYLGVIQVLVKYIGRFLSFCLGTSAAESLSASANIFLGILGRRPCGKSAGHGLWGRTTQCPCPANLPQGPQVSTGQAVSDMTNSELHAVMTGGFATIAGSVLGAYIGMGIEAKHLLCASVMSAPAALAMSKLTCPETEPEKVAKNQDFDKIGESEDRHIIEAAANGAIFTIKLVANITVILLAFISILGFINSALTWFGDRVGIDNLTFEVIASYVLYPVAMFMGADLKDCKKLAELIGVKTFTNEFVAYTRLGNIIQKNNPIFEDYLKTYNSSSAWEWKGSDVYLKYTNTTLQYGVLFEDRSVVIATYALCGFANFGAIGVALGAMSALAPKKSKVLAKLVIRAMIAGNIACFLTACVAGMLFEG